MAVGRGYAPDATREPESGKLRRSGTPDTRDNRSTVGRGYAPDDPRQLARGRREDRGRTPEASKSESLRGRSPDLRRRASRTDNTAEERRVGDQGDSARRSSGTRQ